jgi:hypothetical protein
MNQQSTKNYPTVKVPISNLIFAILIWIAIGLIVTSVIYTFVSFNYIFFIFFTVLISVTGVIWDTEKINADDIGSCYDFKDSPVRNYRGGGFVWLRFHYFYIKGVYDATDRVDSVVIERATTSDRDPRQFVSYTADIESRMVDPLAFEIVSGSDDGDRLIERTQRDEIMKWSRKFSLSELENEDNPVINQEDERSKEIFDYIKKYMLRYGKEIVSEIRILDISATSDKARDEYAEQQYREQTEDFKQMEFYKRVYYNYLQHLARYIEGKDNLHFIKLAKKELTDEMKQLPEEEREEVNGYMIASRACALAEKRVTTKVDFKKLYDECLVQEQNRQGIVPKTQNEILGAKGNNALPIINLGNKK